VVGGQERALEGGAEGIDAADRKAHGGDCPGTPCEAACERLNINRRMMENRALLCPST
jgi:hypothetical protein